MLTETQLLVAISSGNSAAFKQLYDSRWLRLYRYAKSIVKTESDAKDVCSEVFATIWEKRKDIEKIDSIDNYLFALVRNRALDMIRTLKRRQGKNVQLEKVPVSVEGHDKRIEILNLYKEVVLNKIHLLPAGCQRIIRLYYMEGLSLDEIAKRLNLSRHTVRNHRYRGLRILKEMSSLPGLTAVAVTVVFVTLHFCSFKHF